MANGDIGPKIILEGEKEYRKAIADINREQRVLTSEMKKVSAEFDGNANSIESLRKKHDVLNKEYDEQVKKIRTLQGALEKAEEVYGENSKEVQNWQIKLNDAEAELSKLDKEIKINEKYLEEAEKSADGTAKSIDEYGKEVKKAEEKTEDFNQELDKVKSSAANFGKATVGAIAGLGAALIGVTESTKEFRNDFAKLEQNANSAGANISDVSQELKNLDAITGETDSNVEALSNLMATGFTGQGLTQAVDALSGAVIKFPDTLKIEGLADGLQETLATGNAIGPFAEMLERLGYNLEDFDKGLSEANSEAEKQQYVLRVLASTGLSSVNRAYRENNKEIIDNANAQYELRETMSDIARGVAPAMNEIMGKLARTASDFADGALPTIIDGMGWVIDNSDTIIGGIAGIATGMAAFKAGSAIQTGIDLAKKAWQGYKTAAEGAAVAQNAMNISQLASPVGILAVGIGALAAGLTIYALNSNDAKTETQLLREELDKSVEKSKEFNNSVKENSQSRKDNVKNVEAEYGATKKLSDQLFDLSEKTNKSNAEKNQMAALVDQLNTTIPNLNLNINEETGLLNKQRSEVNNLIDVNLEYAKVKAAQEDLIGILEEQYEAEKELYTAEKEKADAQKEFKELEKERIRLLEEGIAYTGSASEAELERTAALAEVNEKMNLQRDIMEAANEKIDETSESVKILGEDWNTTNEYINNGVSISEATVKLGDFGDAAETTSIKVTSANKEQVESIQESQAKYQEVLEETTDSIYDSMGLFDEFSKNTEVSAKTLLDNLESQVKGMEEWASNMDSLSKKGIEEGLLQELYDMGPAAAGEIAALNTMTDKELSEYESKWKRKTKAARTGAEQETSSMRKEIENEIKKLPGEASTVAENTGKKLAIGINNQKPEVVRKTENIVTDAIAGASRESAGAKTVGENLAIGMQNGVSSKSWSFVNVVEKMAQSAITAAKKKLDINSPSGVFEEIGENTIDGFIEGVQNRSAAANKEIELAMPTDVAVEGSYAMQNQLNTPIQSNSFNEQRLVATVEVPFIVGTQELGRALIKVQLENDELYNVTPAWG